MASAPRAAFDAYMMQIALAVGARGPMRVADRVRNP